MCMSDSNQIFGVEHPMAHRPGINDIGEHSLIMG